MEDNNTNQTYTVEEKTGKIIKVEEANEKQKQQKKNLKITIVALCTAIGIGGVSIGVNHFNSQQEQNITVETTIDSNTDFSQIQQVESSLKDYHNVATDNEQKQILSDIYGEIKNIDNMNQNYPDIGVYQEYTRKQNEDGTYSEWVPTNNILVGGYNFQDSTTSQHRLISEAKENDALYRKQVREVTTDSNGNYQSASEWKLTENYFVGKIAPATTISDRYIPVGIIKDNNIVTDFENLNNESTINEESVEEVVRSK